MSARNSGKGVEQRDTRTLCGVIRLTWNDVEVPIITAMAELEQADRSFTWERLLEMTGLEPDVAARAMQRLSDGDYIEGHSYKEGGQMHAEWISARLLPDALPVAGVWPSEDDPLEALIEVLDARIRSSDEEEGRRGLEQFKEAAKKVGPTVVGGVLAASAKKLMGLE